MLNDEKIVNESEMPFTIFFSASQNTQLNKNAVSVDNLNELKRLLYCIGNNSTIIFDDDTKALHPNIYSSYTSGKILEICNDINWNYNDPEEVIQLIKKIILPTYILENLGANPSPIKKEYVHKQNQKNVFISESNQFGNIFFFKGFSGIPEIQTDHESDHFDGIKIFEVSRQASIAAMALNGFPLDAINILTKNSISFKKFIDKNMPYYIQAIPMVQPNGGYLYCAFSIIQNNDICAYGYFAGIGYTSKEEYLKIRKRSANSK